MPQASEGQGPSCLELLIKSTGLSWEVSGGNFEPDHPGQLATDGDEDTYLSAIPAGGSVTVTCRFKKIYGVKQISAVLPSSAILGINLALYKGPSQVIAFSPLDKARQSQKTHTATNGDQIRFTFHETIKLAEIRIYVGNKPSYSGKNFIFCRKREFLFST